jgi:hypothetical protein
VLRKGERGGGELWPRIWNKVRCYWEHMGNIIEGLGFREHMGNIIENIWVNKNFLNPRKKVATILFFLHQPIPFCTKHTIPLLATE